jgi:hypothetical protein
MVVKSELSRIGIPYTIVELGEVEMPANISAEQHDQLKEALSRSGLELMDDKKSVLIERIKKVIVELVHYSEEPLAINLSAYLNQKLNYDYTYWPIFFQRSRALPLKSFL